MTSPIFRSALGLAIAATATLLTIAGAAAPVQAASVRTALVSTSGLDLNSATGRIIAAQRIGFAARQICAASDPRALDQARAARACTTAAIAAATPRIAAIAAARSSGTLLADASPAGTAAR